ncbi:MAG: FtsW/RodA/SpoVE family cell cycle protein [Anaerolineae bacterium]|nr:FtsW/RodA/SpoVE family cell cycle protein [Anaerolineae bacterium]
MVKNIESRLFMLAALFLAIYSVILTLSPSVRERSWDVAYLWQHWVGFLLWSAVFAYAYKEFKREFSESDPFLLPIAALLTGWGLLTIWRLSPLFGFRQSLWMAGIVFAISFSLRFKLDLELFRRYKYLILAGGLLLTFLTLILGSNPAGTGPRLWLGCCGLYFQPSEPLKLLLVGYLAAYLADRLPARDRLIPLLLPTILVAGLALLLLIVQRDLGTASIFIILYATIVFLAIGRRRVLLISGGILLLAGLIGYFFIELIQIRVDAWINPWLDPSGRSYQIIQSLLAIANGGIAGRGPGLGSPGLVPIPHSDFIFTAIAEEMGLVGVMGLLALFGFLISRGIRIALLAPGRYERLLAAGITAYFSIQSLMIIGGNLRVLPLTGVTLPFVSYGGSSLLTSFIGLWALLKISDQSLDEPAPLLKPIPYYIFSATFALGLVVISLVTGWWIIFRGSDLLTRTDNARRSISDRYVHRGDLLDRNNSPINVSQGETGNLTRYYLVPELAPITGYTHNIYGQAGLEATLDEYLRGLRGNPASLIWWDRLLYGTPPPGLDIRLSIDLSLQETADNLLGSHKGGLVLMNANTGELLVVVSQPSFDPNNLDEIGTELAIDKNAPLINRVTQGQYNPENTISLFSQAILGSDSPSTSAQKMDLYQSLGFDNQPQIRIPVAEVTAGELGNVSPLQMALAAAIFSNNGERPTPRIAMGLNTPMQGWVVLPALGEPVHVLAPNTAHETAQTLAGDKLYWSFTSEPGGDPAITWYLAGTLPEWKGTPLILVVLLEENNPKLAGRIGEKLLDSAIGP